MSETRQPGSVAEDNISRNPCNTRRGQDAIGLGTCLAGADPAVTATPVKEVIRWGRIGGYDPTFCRPLEPLHVAWQL